MNQYFWYKICMIPNQTVLFLHYWGFIELKKKKRKNPQKSNHSQILFTHYPVLIAIIANIIALCYVNCQFHLFANIGNISKPTTVGITNQIFAQCQSIQIQLRSYRKQYIKSLNFMFISFFVLISLCILHVTLLCTFKFANSCIQQFYFILICLFYSMS